MTALFRQDVFFLRNFIPNRPRSQPTQKGDYITMYTQDIVGGYRRYIQLYMIWVLPKKD